MKVIRKTNGEQGPAINRNEKERAMALFVRPYSKRQVSPPLNREHMLVHKETKRAIALYTRLEPLRSESHTDDEL